MRFKLYLLLLLISFFSTKTWSNQYFPSDKTLRSINNLYDLDLDEYRYHFDANYFSKLNYYDFNLLTVYKTGSHLVGKLLSLMTGKIPLVNIRTNLQYHNTHNDSFIWSHEIRCFSNDKKNIITYRDFRDTFISYIYFKHWEKNKNWNMQEKQVQNILTQILNSLKYQNPPTIPFGKQIPTMIEAINFWKQKFIAKEKTPNSYPNLFFVKFENIIGAKGNGSYLQQLQTIQELAQYLNIFLSKNQLEYLCRVLHGKSFSFRKGQIGYWKEFFTEEHKKLFKELFNDILVDFGYEKDENW